MTARWHDAGATADIASKDLASARITGGLSVITRAAGAPPDTGGKCTLADQFPTGSFTMNAAMKCPAHRGQFCSRAGKTAVGSIFGTLQVGEARVENPPTVVRV